MQPNDFHGRDPLAGGPGGGTDELRRIVERAGRRRWRAVGAGAAAALVLGAGVGYAVSNAGSSGQTVLSAGQSSSSTTLPAGGASAALSPEVGGGVANTAPYPLGKPESLKRLFVRTTGDITIRGFQSTLVVEPAMAGACGLVPSPSQFLAEVSTPDMVGTAGTAFAPYVASSSHRTALQETYAEQLGTAEGDPTIVVLIKTSPEVTNVAVKFAGEKADSMAPVEGWSALAASGVVPQSGQVATVTATGSSGANLGTMKVTMGFAFGDGALPGPVSNSACCGGGVTMSPQTVPSAPVVTTVPSTGAPASGGSAGSAGGVSSGGAVSSGAAASSGGVASYACACPTIRANAPMGCAKPFLPPSNKTPPAPTSLPVQKGVVNGATTSAGPPQTAIPGSATGTATVSPATTVAVSGG
jgi:hypothetical protein